MIRIALFVVGAIVAGAWADNKPPTVVGGRIVGGELADIGEFPHQVSLRERGRHFCGGSILSADIIVTAAHCVSDMRNVKGFTVAAGVTLRSQRDVEIPVHSFIIHEEYQEFNNNNDIAILVLSQPLSFNANIQPIALATERPEAGTEVTVSGWGKVAEEGPGSEQLQKVSLKVMDDSKCKKAYSIRYTSRMMCAGVEAGGKDACQGDSGGPLIANNELVGIVSWGIGCGRLGKPGVYASVASLENWIVSTAQQHSSTYVSRTRKM